MFIKKIIIFFQILFCSFIISAQQNYFTLSGTVYDCEVPRTIKGVTIKLVASDGVSCEQRTDSLGYYFFDSSLVKKGKEYVVFVSGSVIMKYVANSDKFAFNTHDSGSVKDIKKNFCLGFYLGYTKKRFPVLLYEKDSISSYTTLSVFDNLDNIKGFLNDNPAYMIHITAYISKDENNSVTNATERASYVRRLLLKKGIDKNRLVIKITEENIIAQFSEFEIKRDKITDEKIEIYKNGRIVMLYVVTTNNSKNNEILKEK